MAALREIGVSLGAAFGIMVIVEFEWSTDVAQAEWWVRALRGFAVDVGSIVPATFPAYARVFHRTSDGERWADVAAANGRVAHAEMQYHEIRRPIGAPPVDDTSQLEYSGALGTMDHDELLVLAEVLGRHTSTPHLWCCVWEGFAQLHGGAAVGRLSSTGDDDRPFEGIVPVGLRSAPKVEIPGRAYYLLEGPRAEIGDLYAFLWRRSPNIWWPADRAWIVATEIDFSWTYVAGSEAAIEELLADDRLEVLRVQPTDGVTWDSDLVNRALDGPAR